MKRESVFVCVCMQMTTSISKRPQQLFCLQPLSIFYFCSSFTSFTSSVMIS